VKTGLFFGSFNPVHIGHMAIANYFVEYTDIEQLWFVISPQNPLKKKKTLLADYHRLELVVRAIDYDTRFRASDVEFHMPRPSYTIDTLTYLEEKYPQHEFAIIMGEDGLASFHKWKNFELIIRNYKRYVYRRPGSDPEFLKNAENIEVVDAPQMEISSSFIRKAISEGHDMRFYVPDKVYQYMDEMHFYEK